MIAIELGEAIVNAETRLKGAKVQEGGFARPKTGPARTQDSYAANDGIDRCFIVFGPPVEEVVTMYGKHLTGDDADSVPLLLVEYGAPHNEESWVYTIASAQLELIPTKLKDFKAPGHNVRKFAMILAGKIRSIQCVRHDIMLPSLLLPDATKHRNALSLISREHQLEMVYRIATKAGRVLGSYDRSQNLVTKFSYTPPSFVMWGGTPMERPKLPRS